MTICHIIIKNVYKSVIFSKLTKGFEMALIIKNLKDLKTVLVTGQRKYSKDYFPLFFSSLLLV